jgi:hypothetical protein
MREFILIILLITLVWASISLWYSIWIDTFHNTLCKYNKIESIKIDDWYFCIDTDKNIIDLIITK